MIQQQCARTHTILIVDDEQPILDMLVALLEEEDFNVLSARDGATALAMAIEAQPDLVLTDLMMPGLDGRALCARLLEHPRTAHIPVVLMTAAGRAMAGDAFVAWIVKPFSIDQLLREIEQRLP